MGKKSVAVEVDDKEGWEMIKRLVGKKKEKREYKSRYGDTEKVKKSKRAKV